MTGILIPGNFRVNQLQFFSLDHEKSISISRSRLETRDWEKNILVIVSKTRFFLQFLEKNIYNFREILTFNRIFFENTGQYTSNACNCLNLDSHSRLKARDYKKKFLSDSLWRFRLWRCFYQVIINFDSKVMIFVWFSVVINSLLSVFNLICVNGIDSSSIVFSTK